MTLPLLLPKKCQEVEVLKPMKSATSKSKCLDKKKLISAKRNREEVTKGLVHATKSTGV